MQKNKYFVPLLMMFVLFFLIAFTTGLNNPFSKVIQTQFTLSTFQSQFGNLAFFIAYIFMGLPASILVNHTGYKKAAAIALCSLFAGVWIVFAGGNIGLIWLYLAGMFVLGCGITILQVVINPMIAALGTPEGANSRMNFGGSFFGVGSVLAPVIVGFIIGNAAVETLSVADVNPLLYTMAGLVLIVMTVLYFVQFPEMNISQQKNEKADYSALRNAKFVAGVIAVFLYVGVEVATGSISFLYLTDIAEKGGLNINAEIAGIVVSLYAFSLLIGRLLGGVIGRKVSNRPQLIAASAAALAMFLIAIFLPETLTVKILDTAVPIKVVLFVCIGFFTSVFWTCIFILATEGMGKQTNIASGIFIMMVCGGGIVPVLQGKLVDKFGFADSYWLGVACLAFIFIYALFIAKSKIVAQS